MLFPFDCITNLVFVETPLEKANVILVPGGSHPQIMRRAAELYLQGFAPWILPSGGENPKLSGWHSEWEFLRAVALDMGVPECAVLKEDCARNTFENARFSWRVLNEQGISVRKAILVCKAYHSRRALLTYQAVFPLDVKYSVAAVADNRGITKENWFLKPEHVALVLGEVEKIGQYFSAQIPAWYMVKKERIVDDALAWAQAHQGEKKYAGLCYGFCEDAYELGGGVELDGQGTTAREAAEAYLARMRADGIQSEGPPPRGSYVFFDWEGNIHGEWRNWGHMGLALGGGRVIHAWDVIRIDTINEIESLASPAGGQPHYTGWASPEIFLQGARVKE